MSREEHKYTHYPRNTTMYWEGTDNEKRWNKHCKDPEKWQELKRNGWNEKTITYEIDDIGFRNPPNTDPSKSVMTFGCSYTFGTGLRYEDIWPTKLLKYFPSVYNVGVGGSSNDKCVFIARGMIPYFKPKVVFHLMPDPDRIDIISEFTNNEMVTLLPNYLQNYEGYYKYRTDEYWQWLHEQRNMYALKRMCSKEGIPYVAIPIRDVPISLTGKREDEIDWGRDLSHFGEEMHDIIAEKMMQKYKEAVRENP